LYIFKIATWQVQQDLMEAMAVLTKQYNSSVPGSAQARDTLDKIKLVKQRLYLANLTQEEYIEIKL
jgi:hypothetical protein